MTLTEALALPAGPELDALVAEKVMGWKRGKAITRHERDSSSDYEEYVWLSVEGHVAARRFRPSSNIAAAWEVVERLGCYLEWNISTSSEGHRVEIVGVPLLLDKIEVVFSGHAAEVTLTLLICRAALKALWKE